MPKLDLLQTELHNFDVIALAETWLHPGIGANEIAFESFSLLERKGRQTNRPGGVVLYVEEGINYRQRYDLESRNIECIWIYITYKHKHVLFGVFYRPSNANAEYFSLTETSLNLALDTGYNDIVITGE